MSYPRGPGHHQTGRGAVYAAYAETGALEVFCPNCHAPAGAFCTHDGTIQRRIPCPDRLPHNPDPEAA